MTPLPKLSAPAHRALASIKVNSVEDLAKFTEKELAQLHGFGPASFRVLKPMMAALNLSFKK